MAEPVTARRGVLSYRSFRRIWFASLIASLGDWIGFVAVIALATRVSKGSGETAVAVVLSARLLPGFFFGPVAGVLLDRWDRRRVMMLCHAGRAVVFVFLPFVDTVLGLVLASLVLEAMAIMWSSAKEASVPNMVPAAQLASANSLSVAAAYGTFPLGSVVFALFAKVSEALGNIDALSTLRVNQESLALWANGFTFIVAAVIVGTTELPRAAPAADVDPEAQPNVMRDLREGWKFIGSSPRVRSVMLGIGAGLFGGGMLVPLGQVFAKEDLGGGQAGFGALISALGFGVAISVIGLSLIQRRLKPEPVFVGAVLAAAACISLGATASSMTPAVLWVAGLGLCAGAVYVLGFTILQTNVDDALRGRTFATLYTMIRVVLLLAFTIAPIMSRLLGSFGSTVGLNVSGVRLSLWMAGGIIAVAGALSLLSLRDPVASRRAHPSNT